MGKVTGDIKFAIVPEWVYEADISHVAVRLFCVLSKAAQQDGDVGLRSRRYLAAQIGSSTSTLDRAREELERIGALTSSPVKRKDGGWGASHYHVHYAHPERPSIHVPEDHSPTMGGGVHTNDETSTKTLSNETISKRKDLVRVPRMRTPDPLWDSFVTFLGRGPATPQERGKWNKGIKALRDAGVDADGVLMLCHAARKRWSKGLDINPQSIATNASSLATRVRGAGEATLALALRLEEEARWK